MESCRSQVVVHREHPDIKQYAAGVKSSSGRSSSVSHPVGQVRCLHHREGPFRCHPREGPASLRQWKCRRRLPLAPRGRDRSSCRCCRGRCCWSKWRGWWRTSSCPSSSSSACSSVGVWALSWLAGPVPSAPAGREGSPGTSCGSSPWLLWPPSPPSPPCAGSGSRETYSPCSCAASGTRESCQKLSAVLTRKNDVINLLAHTSSGPPAHDHPGANAVFPRTPVPSSPYIFSSFYHCGFAIIP